MNVWVRSIAAGAVWLLLALAPVHASAQQRQPSASAYAARATSPAPVRALDAGSFALTPTPTKNAAADRPGEASRSPWRLPLIGTGVGAGLGALAVFAACEQGSCFGENAGIVVGGAVLGAATGAAIELVRRHF